MGVLTAVVGEAKDFPLQCWFYGRRAPAKFLSTDIMNVYLCVDNQVTLPPPSYVFLPVISWYTSFGTQTGYDEGQVLVSFTNAQIAALVPGFNYTLIITQATIANPSDFQCVGRTQFVVTNPTLF
jgi:hypothetical protein